jgi:hypothetical protein
MRTAVICLAYHCNPVGVDLLAGYFDGLDVDLFLHVDAKVDTMAYAEVIEKWRLRTVSRETIYWGGWNTVRAIINSCREARASQEYGRYLVITEDTIPIVSRNAFTAAMQSDTEFLVSQVTTNPNMLYRYKGWFFMDSLATTTRPVKMMDRTIDPTFLASIDRLRGAMQRGKAVLPELRHGPGWWGLSARHVDSLIRSFDTDLQLRESFEFSLIPEEQYFQTVVGPLEQTNPLIYADWTRPITPWVFSLAEEISAALPQAKTAPFLRKIRLDSPEIAEFVQQLG